MRKKRRTGKLIKAVTDMFDLPAELLTNLPRISIAGREDLFVENHQGIIECTLKRIRFATNIGTVVVKGDELVLKHFGVERIAIHGCIDTVEYAERT